MISGDLIGRKSGAEDAEIEAPVGRHLVNKGFNVDVLHVNHHGANNTSSTQFLNSIKAETAIISCGDNNKHGHPTVGNLERLIGSGVENIFLTNKGNASGEVPNYITNSTQVFDGHIVIETDGKSYPGLKFSSASL